MTKFHINHEGVPGVCKALKNCPFGLPLDSHFNSYTEAQEAFESTMNDNTLTAFKRGSPEFKAVEQPFLHDIVDVDLLADMIREDYIRKAVHPENEDLQILCYTQNTQNDGKWNDATKLARGLIIEASNNDLSSAVVIQRPWSKFFSLQQIESKWALGDDENIVSAMNELELINFDAPAEVTDKMDGSMGILYRAPNGKPAFSTKGSFTSDQANYYTKFLHENPVMLNATEKLLTEHNDTTFLFELTGKDNRIVLTYDEDDVSMLGAVRKHDGLYYSTKDFDKTWKNNGLNVAETMPAKTLREAFELPDRENKEGLVVRIISSNPKEQFQIKIKQEDYVKLHKLFTNFNKKDARLTLRSSPATYKDIVESSKNNSALFIPGVKEQVIIEGHENDAPLTDFREKLFHDYVFPKAHAIRQAIEDIEKMNEDEFVGDKKH